MDLRELTAPVHTAVVTSECQGGVLGDPAIFPELAAAARQAGVVERVAQLVTSARRAGVAVVHAVFERYPGGRGANHNARLFAAAAGSPVELTPGTAATRVLPELYDDGSDIVLTRRHGVGPMGGTDLDPVLRNLDVRTIVAAGVSVNVALLDLVLGAVNAGYRVVVARDAVAGVPPAYAEAVLDHTLAVLATLTTTDALCDGWAGTGAPA